MDDYARDLLDSFEMWLHSRNEQCHDIVSLRLLEELDDVVVEFLNKKIRKYRKLREINEIFEEAMLIQTKDRVTVVTFNLT
ncbi:hypothetical protein PsunGV_gp044 [Pseudalatia unipuncta granulovirus]|jgi:hypothetical protein|uniref:Uncharacterized protein n=1 Tax=Pseudalatia unipuncta granulosis virus TaxID=36355 RepID=B6S6R3_GVPU|nr:hypothetical protein PsunGV_gp044 [Pseudalatia unipuncta granulovirus]ACH69394.1 unknown [Pseudalatia unipuncta granulovirus]